MKKLFLKPGKEAAVERYHPWVFSGAVKRMEGHPADGELVEVYDQAGRYLATGHYQDGSICVRIFSRQPTGAGPDFWRDKLGAALDYRQKAGLAGSEHTNCYRLVHAEGDGMPGLIIDIYDRTAVVQCHSIGMHGEREKLVAALRSLYGRDLEAVYDKSRDTLPAAYATDVENGYLLGKSLHKVARENGHSFLVDWEGGQKTGFFLDQRDNRQLLSRYAPHKRVLNAFAYSGGFSVYALHAGARHVDSVDVSGRAIDLAVQNVELNQVEGASHQAFAEDVMQFLRRTTEPYDLMVIDPPAFTKSIQKRHNAVQGYKRLNALALQKLKPGGILFTFSCSQVVDKALFDNTIVAAALEAGRQARIMHHLSQPADHPVSIFHPEGAYLKGLVLYVE